jgi:NO-binding membrane sensor protein with MHYT domain
MVDLVKAYAKQETVQPLRNTGKFLVRGLAGGLLMAIGLILLCFAGLRAMQTETHAFDHGWSFVPYLVVVAGAAIVAVLFVMRISKGGLDG